MEQRKWWENTSISRQWINDNSLLLYPFGDTIMVLPLSLFSLSVRLVAKASKNSTIQWILRQLICVEYVTLRFGDRYDCLSSFFCLAFSRYNADSIKEDLFYSKCQFSDIYNFKKHYVIQKTLSDIAKRNLQDILALNVKNSSHDLYIFKHNTTKFANGKLSAIWQLKTVNSLAAGKCGSNFNVEFSN